MIRRPAAISLTDGALGQHAGDVGRANSHDVQERLHVKQAPRPNQTRGQLRSDAAARILRICDYRVTLRERASVEAHHHLH